jgi:membrane-bound lytic murein transglycosylase D
MTGSRHHTLLIAGLVAMCCAGCTTTEPERAVDPPPPAEAAEVTDQIEPAAEPEEQTQAEATQTPPSIDAGAELDPIEDADAEPSPEVEPEPDPEAMLEEALEACTSAQEFWKEGSLEDALAALDRAYELMLALPNDDDPRFAQHKDDIRHLVSRRIVEIYASQRTTVGELDRTIPVDSNSFVEREIRGFQGQERQFFIDSYRRSGLYRPMILRELRAAGMPEQLSWLPLIESGFKVRAYSRARALGLWQFISSTGYRFGLRRDWWIDERMDPERSTRAAIAYLTELHGMFGDWLTAIAAYNCGENRVLRVINSQRLNYMDQFWDLFQQLPYETARYVPRFLATLLIVNDPAAYGFDLPPPYPTLEYDRLKVNRSVELATLDRAMSLPADTLKQLNPELRQGATPDRDYVLRVPPTTVPEFTVKLAELPKWKPPAQRYTVHRVRKGETLSHIARRYGTSVSALRRANRLRNPNRLYPGQRINVPGRGGAAPVQRASAPPPVSPGTTDTYVVRRGDNLWRLARRYATTVEAITRENNLSSDRLAVGQRLKITAGGKPVATSGSYVVRSGDTLSAIARTHRVSLNALLRANGLSSRSTIYPGQVLSIP